MAESDSLLPLGLVHTSRQWLKVGAAEFAHRFSGSSEISVPGKHP